MRHFLFLGLLFSTQIFSQEHYLVINPDGHKSIIFDTDIDADGNIVSGSFDKTVKVWDVEKGFIKREFLGQIGPGSEGMIYSVDVSPDNKYLAVAGWFGKDDETEDLGDIRIYDYKTGFLKKRLKFHEDVVRTVKFTDDSNYLISGDASGFIVKWDFLSGAPFLYDRMSLSLSNLDTHLDYFVTTHEDGMIYKWDYLKSKPIKKIPFFTKVKDMAITPEVAISANGTHIAVSGKEIGMVLIFDAKFSMQDYFFIDNYEVIDMSFSPSENRILLALKNPGKNRAMVYELQGKKWIEIATYKNHDDLVKCVEFLDEKTCMSSGGLKNEIAIWQIENDGKTKELSVLFAKGSAIFSAALNESGLAFSRDPKLAYGFAPYTELFDIFSRQMVKEVSDFSKFSYPLKEKNNWSMYEEEKVRDSELDPSEVLYLLKDKKIVDSVLRYPWQGSRHDTYSFIGSEFFVSGGSYGTLEAYNYKAKLKSRFVGHEGDVRSITTSANGDFMITSGTDMTIRIWPIKEIGKTNEVNSIYPLASIFIAENNEWVIWNTEGYFTSSKKGAKYVGYHVNQGKGKEAKFYPFDQFDMKYNRPDIILKSLGLADSGTIDLYERAYLKRLKRMGLTDEDLQADIHAPNLNIVKYQVNGSILKLDLKASDEKYTLNRINVFINDVPIYGRKGLDMKDKTIQTYTGTLDVELMNGENKVQVSVLNSNGVESMRETVYATFNQTTPGDLYIISMGVSNYKDTKFNLNYAAKDAEDMVNAFEGNTVYETVHQKVIINEQVTRENIFELKEFLKAARTNDVVMLFIAGHGVLDKNLDYYYCTHDVDFQHPELRGVSYSELETLFDGIKAIRKILIMDTCHSGELDKEDVEEVEFESTETGDVTFRNVSASTAIRERQGLKKTNEAVKEMFNDLNRGTGATIISSSGGAEYSMESADWKNGLFTYCLLNGLKSKVADINKDGKILISELQIYVQQMVAKLSNGKQMPSSRFENISLDYVIW